jgi:hypothetical protein
MITKLNTKEEIKKAKNAFKQLETTKKAERESWLEKHVVVNFKGITTGILETEKELEDSYPINYYSYVCKCDQFPNGTVIRSDVAGNVRTLKNDLADYRKWTNIVIFNCDLKNRNLI